ncbi:hypothetical protein [Natronosalvus rutilus]|uniref:Uncharacterized protein n=1 Tax=Natronosalvus rutilus TaxID=2953753 RepID=A0A9E7SWF6_9EURY|nr:hypothetical protein [Natronosalvus rutilus]UTF53128.1 hypothetical protein NGM29_15325 [Natronosalvus rutilus]
MTKSGGRRMATLVVLLSVVLAGCAAPMADVGSVDGSTGDDRATGERTLEVHGDLPLDANATFDRVQSLLAIDLRPPTVYVDEPIERPPRAVQDPSSFYAVMGIPAPDPTDGAEELRVGGVSSAMQAVYLLPEADASPAEIEQVFVHELVHTAQFQRGAPQRVQAEIPAEHRGTTDARLTVTSLIEGSAVYVSSAYTEAYDLPVTPEDDLLESLYPNASPGTRLSWGPYHHGGRYVAAAADSPATHWSVYETPPVTMQEVRRGEPAIAMGEAELEPFEIEVGVDAESAGWESDPTGTDVVGSFVLEQVLATELDTDAARDAAAGWSYDRVRRISNDGAMAGDDSSGDEVDSYAWAIRFEDESNASLATDAMATALERRATSLEAESGTHTSNRTPTTTRWRTESYAFSLEHADDQTLVLFAGDEAFVESVSLEEVSATGDVQVAFDERDSTASSADSSRRLSSSEVTETTQPAVRPARPSPGDALSDARSTARDAVLAGGAR